ncbi:MAG: class I SAM-dependent methyltransferase [Acidobacteriota bacterium]|nr:class I SAM-dependent methyltransferase [Acidobacteriota bacterium]
MNRKTIDALEAINRRFYRLHSREFSATRSRPWPGWQLVLDSFRRHGRALGSEHRDPIVDSLTPFEVLDAGCGNGRFARFLGSDGENGVRYLGADASLALVAEARQAGAQRPRLEASWVVADLCGSETRSWPLGGRTGVARTAVVFGVLHHVAAFDRRLALLSSLGSTLEPGGLLAVSFWQFGGRRRFLKRTIPWEEYNRRTADSVDVGELEAGDSLLVWGEKGDTNERLRYCHYADPEESAELAAATGLELVETFEADGRGDDLNLYYVLRRPSSI